MEEYEDEMGRVTITPEMQQRYDAKFDEAFQIEERRILVHDHYLQSRIHTNAAKVWFWRFKAEAREEVRKRQIPEMEAYGKLQEVDRQYRHALSDAKSELGVWTSAGVEGSRSLFWESYKNAKIYAQRQTFFDVFYSLLLHRDGDAMRRLMEFIVIACLNFTSSMLVAFFIFLARLVGFIRAFQPSFLSGGIFFVTCLIGGASVIATFLGLMYGSSLVIITVLASRGQFIEGGRERERLYNRPHAE